MLAIWILKAFQQNALMWLPIYALRFLLLDGIKNLLKQKIPTKTGAWKIYRPVIDRPEKL